MPIIAAHRGVHNKEHENTLKAFEKAIELNCDMIELDVRMTKDNVFICLHDPSLNDIPSSTLTYEEIENLANSQGFSIPTLEAALKSTAGKIKLDIELKEAGYEKEVLTLILKYFNKNDFVITSFYDDCVKEIKKLHPELKAGLLLGMSEAGIKTRLSELFPKERLNKSHADFLAVNYKLLRLGFLERTKKANIPIYVWTVDDENLINKLIVDERIACIITNYPQKAIDIRKDRKVV